MILFTSPYSPHSSSRDLINQLMPLLARPNFLLFSCNGHARKAIAKLWFAVVTLFNLSKIWPHASYILGKKSSKRLKAIFILRRQRKKMSIAWYVLYSTLLGLYCCKFHSRNWKLSGLYCNKKEDRLLWECWYTITNQTKMMMYITEMHSYFMGWDTLYRLT